MMKRFKVSTKAAIFNPEGTKVLVIHMDKINDYGLPGGHVDEGEDIGLSETSYDDARKKYSKLTRAAL